ncbi:hypothetical protein [Alicyclobacillus fastidiosus]|uniref:Uncharacterized protein n=1 Tax=Alicyclobacillus fastidiosus TaxID=392011 RepID=A0ABV5ALB8_9BACL|nr:hypothetical protein [Alicyclobacillus fastidiosus]WEH12175.1 hypothetical protein PYS47_16130 [Alicyclobacillus fastidiosus]
MGMDMEDVKFAQLSQDTLNDIKRLEEQLRAETHRDIILLAYEESAPKPEGTRNP